jgi:plastocyanin
MNKYFSPLLLMIGLMAFGRSADAARLEARITDDSGNPVADAVITLVPNDTTLPLPDPSPPLASAVIDQRDEMFVPYVVAVAKGGTVTFRNSDQTRHHVYSFSPIKQFEFMMNPGESAAAIPFDVAGIAAIGCNLHDFMTAFVFVADTPFVALSDRDGRALIANLPPGAYGARVWHPLLARSSDVAVKAVDIPPAGTTLAITLPLTQMLHHDPEHGLY